MISEQWSGRQGAGFWGGEQEDGVKGADASGMDCNSIMESLCAGGRKLSANSGKVFAACFQGFRGKLGWEGVAESGKVGLGGGLLW